LVAHTFDPVVPETGHLIVVGSRLDMAEVVHCKHLEVAAELGGMIVASWTPLEDLSAVPLAEVTQDRLGVEDSDQFPRLPGFPLGMVEGQTVEYCLISLVVEQKADIPLVTTAYLIVESDCLMLTVE
jgi:hypothetical protein